MLFAFRKGADEGFHLNRGSVGINQSSERWHHYEPRAPSITSEVHSVNCPIFSRRRRIYLGDRVQSTLEFLGIVWSSHVKQREFRMFPDTCGCSKVIIKSGSAGQLSSYKRALGFHTKLALLPWDLTDRSCVSAHPTNPFMMVAVAR